MRPSRKNPEDTCTASNRNTPALYKQTFVNCRLVLSLNTAQPIITQAKSTKRSGIRSLDSILSQPNDARKRINQFTGNELRRLIAIPAAAEPTAESLWLPTSLRTL